MSYVLEARGICVNSNARTLLNSVDLSVSAREIVTIIGPNGAGKTTLVRVLLGLLKPDAGTLVRAPALRIGYMPQVLHLDAQIPLTVHRFLRLASNSVASVAKVASTTGIQPLLSQPMGRLSGGETQRVLLARALLRQPGLLVLDEPVQGVDVAGQSELYRLIPRLRDELGCAILMVSHDLHLVMAATDTVVCLNSHVCCSGHPDVISKHPQYLELFGLPTSSPLAVYTHHHDHTHEPGEQCHGGHS